jgi:hypothetical protein
MQLKTHKCEFIFYNERYGEMMYEVVGETDYPEHIDAPKFTSTLDGNKKHQFQMEITNHQRQASENSYCDMLRKATRVEERA